MIIEKDKFMYIPVNIDISQGVTDFPINIEGRSLQYLTGKLDIQVKLETRSHGSLTLNPNDRIEMPQNVTFKHAYVSASARPETITIVVGSERINIIPGNTVKEIAATENARTKHAREGNSFYARYSFVSSGTFWRYLFLVNSTDSDKYLEVNQLRLWLTTGSATGFWMGYMYNHGLYLPTEAGYPVRSDTGRSTRSGVLVMDRLTTDPDFYDTLYEYLLMQSSEPQKLFKFDSPPIIAPGDAIGVRSNNLSMGGEGNFQWCEVVL